VNQGLGLIWLWIKSENINIPLCMRYEILEVRTVPSKCLYIAQVTKQRTGVNANSVIRY
jgi:hypothetical protein